MKKIFSFVPAAFCSFLVLAAAVIIRPMCVGFFYQPEQPESLRR